MNLSIIKTMIDEIDKPAIFIDMNYVILAVNALYLETYDIPVELGKSTCFEISHGHSDPCDKFGEDCPMKLCEQSQSSQSVIHNHHTSRGKTYCKINMKTIQDEDGITIGFLEILDRIDYASAEPTKQKMLGRSPAFLSLLQEINTVAKSEINVLLQGETGTGKELTARAIHDSSVRSFGPYKVIECTGLNENLFESELFGHEKGAFTGAQTTKKGLIELADTGTVFFDEIADVPLAMQVKLLRLLESKTFRRVGGIKEIHSDFRIICASHQNLSELVKQGKFRKDLYYRLCGYPIYLPSLHERVADIALIAESLLNETELHYKKFSQKALSKLSSLAYPGNIRELKNIVYRSALKAPENLIESKHIEATQTLNEIVEDKIYTLEEQEGIYLKKHYTQEMTVPMLAKKLGVSERTLYRKLQKHGLSN
jgi:transcriptional regulator with PAS, ATPase and Fis domain